MVDLSAALDRFFRAYYAQCVSPTEDTLFNFLNGMHSLNDKMNKYCSTSLFGSQNFIALKALRNLFHHHAELVHCARFIRAQELPPLTTDLAILCLVERSLVERAAHLKQERDPQAVMTGFKVYGTIANIQPAIFNVAVDIFEVIKEVKVSPSSEAYQEFEASYWAEEVHGHSHRVSGDIFCRAGDVNEVLKKAFVLKDSRSQ